MGSLTLDGALDEVAGMTLVCQEFVVPASGHPEGFVYAWAMNDAHNLYVSLDVTPDNTMDTGGDYAKVHVNTPEGIRVFNVDASDTRWGVAEFVYTDKVGYQHKVYEIAIPLEEIGIAGATEGQSVQLGFSVYGTVATVNPTNFQAPQTHTVAIAPGVDGVGQFSYLAAADFIEDPGGKTDIAIIDENSNGINVYVIPGNGDGTFDFPNRETDEAGYAPVWVEAADLNKDGHQDLVVVSRGGTLATLLGDGPGTFADAVHYNYENNVKAFGNVCLADFNGDDYPDIAVCNNSDDQVCVLINDTEGAFADGVLYPTGDGPSRVVAADHQVTSDLYLPTSGPYGTSISWESNDEDVISTTGQVTRPQAGEGEKQVVLNATVWRGARSGWKTFVITVLEETSAPPDPPAPPETTWTPGYFQFTTRAYSVSEGVGKATISVMRWGGAQGEFTINYSTSDGTALAGIDYGAVSGVLTFAEGETLKTFDIPIFRDNVAEEDETVPLRFVSETLGATVEYDHPTRGITIIR